MPQNRTRVLIVDDSALMRKHLRQILESDDGFELAFARNGREALEKAQEFEPDVVTLDINMPEMDGLTCLQRLLAKGSKARVVMVSSLTAAGAEATLKALDLGAVDFVHKPDGTVSLNIDRIRDTLLTKVRAASRARPRRARGLIERTRANRQDVERRTVNAGASRPQGMGTIPGLVLIGVSTGGPRTLDEILPALPANFPYAVVVAQHMPASFTGVFAKRMDGICKLEVLELDGVAPLQTGQILIGRGDYDVVIERRLGRLVACSVSPDDGLWHPSADRMVASALKAMPAASMIGVLLTGMGTDGASAMTALRRAGGHTIAESEESAVVFGMPAELIRQGGAEIVLSADTVAEQLLAWAR